MHCADSVSGAETRKGNHGPYRSCGGLPYKVMWECEPEGTYSLAVISESQDGYAMIGGTGNEESIDVQGTLSGGNRRQRGLPVYKMCIRDSLRVMGLTHIIIQYLCFHVNRACICIAHIGKG